MAIKIIKNTMIDPIEMTCNNCKSVFTYNFQDIQRREERLFFGAGTTIERYVTCPGGLLRRKNPRSPRRSQKRKVQKKKRFIAQNANISKMS